MPPALRDRRSGVIETEAQIAGSVLEPWRTDNASAAQAVENTVAFQRRRARFEFTPAGFQEPPRDLTKVPDDLELRVWVFVERASTPGLRRSTWTRSKTTTTQLVAPEGDTGPAPTTSWTPVTRDVAYERRLLAAVQDGLRSQGQ